MVDICDMGEDILDEEKEKEETENNGKRVNPHTFGTLEWQKVEEEKIVKDSENRLKRMEQLHSSMNNIWKEKYIETEKVFNDFLPMNTNTGNKSGCTPPKLDKFPLNKHCDVAKYKKCVTNLINKAFEPTEDENY